MSEFILNLWLPESCTGEASERCKALDNVRIYAQERLNEYRNDLTGLQKCVNLVELPTNGKFVLVSKKILNFRLKLRQPAEPKDIYFALWPSHPEYRVGVDAQPAFHHTFLPGLTTYHCTADGDGFRITAAAAPHIPEEEILGEIRAKLEAAGIPTDALSYEGVQQDGFRAELESTILDTLVRTSFRVNNSGPDFEWYPVPSCLTEIGRTLPNTFALGTGTFPDPMCVSWEEDRDQKLILRPDDHFWEFVRQFSRMLP